jgi:hypothetical protein
MTITIKVMIICTLMAMTINTAYPPRFHPTLYNQLDKEFIFSSKLINSPGHVNLHDPNYGYGRIDTDRLLTHNTFILLLGALLVSFNLKSKGSISLKEGDS